MPASRTTRLLLLGCVALLAACSSQSPRSEVLASRVAERTESHVLIMTDIAIENPGREELPLEEYDYFVLAGGSLFRGRRQAMQTVPPETSVIVTLPGVITTGPEAPALDEVEVLGSVNYVVDAPLAQFLFDAGVWRPKIGFSGSTRLDPEAAAPDSRSP